MADQAERVILEAEDQVTPVVDKANAGLDRFESGLHALGGGGCQPPHVVGRLAQVNRPRHCAVVAQPAAAQVEDKPVPMDKAPFHIPVFSNDYLILLNVNIPPGRNTGYHIHYADSVSVNLTPASQTNQNYGSSEVSAPGTGGDGEPGRATFTDVTKNGPRTHKATNVGPTPFHNISFILKNRAPAGTTVSDRSGVRGYTQIMDNARLRGWRACLPGCGGPARARRR